MKINIQSTIFNVVKEGSFYSLQQHEGETLVERRKIVTRPRKVLQSEVFASGKCVIPIPESEIENVLGSLLSAEDQSDFKVFKECSRRNEIMKPYEVNLTLM